MSPKIDPGVGKRARQAAIGLAVVVLLVLLGQGLTRRARAPRPRPQTARLAAVPVAPAVPSSPTMPQPERDPFAPTMVTAPPETATLPTDPTTGPAPITVPEPSLSPVQPLPAPPGEPVTERSATLPDIQPERPRRRRRNQPTATLPDIREEPAIKPVVKQPVKKPATPAVKPTTAAVPAGEWLEPPAVGDDLQLEGVVVGSRREARLRIKGNSVPATEGDLVGGYRVERVDRNEVVLSRNGARYRLTLPGGPRLGGSRNPTEPGPPKLGPPAPPAPGKTS